MPDRESRADPKPVRCFLGFELSLSLRQAIEALQEKLRPELPSLRWVPASNLHLTLRFLGARPLEIVDALRRDLKEPVAAVEPFSLELRGCGVFPSVRRPQVFWVGVQELPPPLLQLRARVDGLLEAFGIEAEARPFEPHLTIARFKKRPGGKGALRDVISGWADATLGTMRVSELVFFESKLTPRGARYLVLERFRLGGKAQQQLV